MSLVYSAIQWQKDHPEVTTTQMAMALGVLNAGGRSALTMLRDGRAVSGRMDPEFCKAAEAHSIDQRNRRHQDHNGQGERLPALDGIVSEIVKQTFDGTFDIMEGALFCANWTSGSHRPDMINSHRAFCYDMRMATDGTWFCTGINAIP